MDEDFQRNIRIGRRFKLRQFTQRKFPRQDGPRDAEPLRKGRAFGRSQRHLRRGVDGQIGHPFPCQRDQAQVLHDGRVDPGAVEQNEFLLGGGELVGEDQDVERDVALHAMVMKKIHQLRQVLWREIRGPHPRIEGGQAEIDRVRAVGHGRARAFPVAGRSEEFGFRAGGRRRDFSGRENGHNEDF